MAADAELMNRYVSGDAGAFRELHARIAPRLVSYLARMCGDRATAEDLVQHTFLKIHRARSAYVKGADPVPWMFAIAHRTFLDEMRRRQRSRVKLAREEGGVPDAPAGLDGAPAERAASGPDPELVRAAMAALEQLPPAQREALVLTKLSGKSMAEAAAITGSTPGAVKLRAHRGYVALRKALGETGSAQ
jgi:RNA polymerase sigma-70 factor (ECF subfamily)